MAKPKGYYSKGKVSSEKAALRAKYGDPRTLKGIASIVGGAIIEGIGGPKAKGAKVAAKAVEGVAPAAARFAKRTGQRIIQDRKGAQILNERAAGGRKISRIAARREAERAAGPRARREGGEAALRASAPKPDAKITTKTSGGGERRAEGPARQIKATLKKRTEGPSRRVDSKETITKGRIVRDRKVTKFEKSPTVTREVVGEKAPSVPKEKVTVSKPKKRTVSKRSEIVIKKIQKRNPADVREERKKVQRDRVRKALTRQPKPLGPNRKLSPAKPDKDRTPNVPDKEQPQGITVRGKLYRDGNPGVPARGQEAQGTIESRLASRSEKPTRGVDDSTSDKEASALASKSLRDLEDSSTKTGADFNPKKRASRIKPGKPTRTTTLIRKKAKPSEIKGAIRNQRRVLKQREITRQANSQTVEEIKAAEVKKSGSWKNGKGK